jgi:hypothetical protein
LTGSAYYNSVQNLSSFCLLSKNLNIKICKIKILPIALYGCETWSLTCRKENRLRVSENTVLRRIFGPEREEVAGGWSRLHNEELHNLHASLNIFRMIKSRRMRWTGHVAFMGGMRNAYKMFVSKPEGKRPLRMPKCRWKIILEWILGK